MKAFELELRGAIDELYELRTAAHSDSTDMKINVGERLYADGKTEAYAEAIRICKSLMEPSTDFYNGSEPITISD